MPEIKLGRLHGGFCVYWWEDGKRRRYQLDARSRKEAEAEAVDVYRRETFKSRPKAETVAEIWAAYVEDLGTKPTAKTMGYTGKSILPHFGAYTPENIDKKMCVEYHKTREKQGISTGTVWTELGHLQSALNFNAALRQIRAAKIWRPAKPAPKERFLTHGEIDRLIDNAASPHIRLAVILLLGTAARVGAILDLHWDRVDFERGTINLRLSDAQTRKGRAVVPMNGMTRAALQTARDAALSDYVVEYAGDRVKSIRKGFTSACERAGLEGVTIHTLRHTAAVHMVAAGIPMSKVSQYLGHSNTTITERVYARFAPSHMQDAADVLDFVRARKA